MQIVYIVIAVLVAGGAYYFYANSGEDSAPESVQIDATGAESHDGTMDAGDSVDSAMSVPTDGTEGGVDEMIVDNVVVNDVNDVDAVGDSQADVMDDPVSEPRVFEVGGANFAFDVPEMRVKAGDTVTVNFVSNGGFHDWVVDEFNAATEQVKEGETTSVTFVADAAGTYEYYCSVGNHRAQGMVGTLIVE